MSTKECIVNRFDHIEITTQDLSTLEKLFERLGFRTTQAKESDVGKQHLMTQGRIRMLLTQGTDGTYQKEYFTKHGEGVCSLGYHVESAKKTLNKLKERGANIIEEHSEEDDGVVRLHKGAISSFGDVRATFVTRSGAPFDPAAPFAPGFKTVGDVEPDKDINLLQIDHLTNNVDMGEMETWATFYKDVYGWEEVRHFNIKASQTGLKSKVLQSTDGACKIPINESTEKEGQVQEFVDVHKGAGVQHIALTTNDIYKTVEALKGRGFKFLKTPHSYYEEVPKRMPNIDEPMDEMENLSILADGDDKGYLLQIFTENQIGPMFFEFIQRKGNNGFGEGNFTALFEAIERDQIERGVLKAKS